MINRLFWVWLHRWCGLAMTVFLVVAGGTGSILAFNTELERVFAPKLFATPKPGVSKLDLATLAEKAQAQLPQARVEAVTFTEPDQASVYFVARTNPASGKPYDLGFDEFFIDPWTGRELGRRESGDLSEGLINLMPFIYSLHWRLALGDTGQWIMGIVALIWTLDCFNGFYLTLPTSLAGFWRRWKPAWLIKRDASFFRLNFDLHRASSLWVWPLLFIFAWSSVMMNIRPVYEAVMKQTFDYQSWEIESNPKTQPNIAPRIGWQEAQALGERLIAEQSIKHHFYAGERLSLMYFPETSTYSYDVRGSSDIFERAPKGGSTSVMFDGNTGAFIELSQPTREHSGNTVESWLYALHMTRVFGFPYQIFVCVLGLIIVMLSVTGVYLWLKKRHAKCFSKDKLARLEETVNA